MIPVIKAKTIVQKVTYPPERWFGIDYNMNLYKGCCHGCIYCDSRSSCYRIENFDQVRVKEDAAAKVRRELFAKRKRGVVGIGAMSDTYNPYERELQVTRRVLEILGNLHFGVSIDTKSTLVTRDIDMLQRINRSACSIVKLTVTTAEDDLAGKLEPCAPSPSRRFEALKELSQAGIFCGVLMTPVLPYLTDREENIRAVVERTAESGGKFIYASFGVTLRDNQRAHYYNCLDRDFPGLSRQYMEQYGSRYLCTSSESRMLSRLFREECRKYGLLYRMEDIISAYRRMEDYRQLSLFSESGDFSGQ